MSTEAENIIASEWRQWSDSRPRLIRALTGGLTNRSFLLQADGEKLVLRVNARNSRALDLDRAAEAEALLRASAQGLCAPLVYIDPEYRYLLTRYIDGAPLDLRHPQALLQIAELLRQVHQLPPISARLDMADKAEHYWQSVDQRTPFFPALSQLHQLMQSLLQRNSSPETHRLCHNDLLPDNLIVDNSGALHAIDWEYAAIGDPFFDLATVAQGYRLDQHQQQVLLAAYLQRTVDAADQQKLAHWQQMYRYLSALWYAVQMSQSGAAPQAQENLMTEITDLLAAFE
ncbi:phosphotransferase [Microbulbifer sp. SA54]|uniref:phosphotransferase n=1 Tax=Microbulbifer sp. SA54 TaxID=3401577 RepID=UPI003AAD5C8D